MVLYGFCSLGKIAINIPYLRWVQWTAQYRGKQGEHLPSLDVLVLICFYITSFFYLSFAIFFCSKSKKQKHKTFLYS